MKIKEIANELYEISNSIVLIYAFNATGKTRLSVAYKDLTKLHNEGNHVGVYYNAFSEDLFSWNNDEENENTDIKLEIKLSRLNQFHSLMMTDEGNTVEDKLKFYNPKYVFELNESDNLENGFESISFYEDEDQTHPIKISRGEERIFIWCFFQALFEIDGLSDQNEHFFIDDPVSSLDEYNIYITADSIYRLIEEGFEEKKKIIVTTHHIGLFSILFDRLKKGEKADRYKKNTDAFVMSNDPKEGLEFNRIRKSVFLFHLHLLQTLDEAIENGLYKYHFALLRQLLENISSFLGTGRINYCLEQIGLEDIDNAMLTINSESHQKLYGLNSSKMSERNEELFKEIFYKLQEKYHFRF